MSDKLHDISQNTERNVNMAHDVRFYVDKPENYLSAQCSSKIEWKLLQFFMHYCRIMHGLSIKCFVINYLSAFMITLLHI